MWASCFEVVSLRDGLKRVADDQILKNSKIFKGEGIEISYTPPRSIFYKPIDPQFS